MGSLESHHQPSSIFPQQSRQINQMDFCIIPNYSYTHQIDPYYSSNFVIFSHKQKPQFQIQKYELFFNTYEEYKVYKQVYEWRNRCKYLVHARTIRERNNNNMCGNFQQATLFVQRIPIRACEITDVPIEEGLYLLYTCFMGFRKIYQRTGYFDIGLDMICINKDALVKIWLNSNLSKIYPESFSPDQNFTQADFILKILAVCEPLIDFAPIQQKLSDFLKNCCIDEYRRSPKKQLDNRFCKYSRSKEQSVNRNKKQLPSNLRNLCFDKIIEYFQAYLNKHKMVISREMKTIKDLFNCQPKIEHKDLMSPQKERVFEKKQCKDDGIEQIEMLPLGEESLKKRTDTKRTNTKRTNKKLSTQRSNNFHSEALFSYKSEECVKKLNKFKEPQLVPNRQPSVSFSGYKPIETTRDNLITTQNMYPSVCSPQHLASSKPFYLHARDRIRTVLLPNIQFSIRPQNTQMEYSLSPKHSYKSSEYMFFKKKGRDQTEFDEKVCKITEQTVRRQSFPGKAETLQKTSELKVVREKNEKESKVVKDKNQKQIDSKNRSIKQALKKVEEDKKRKIYYGVQKQVSIDDQIACDLEKFEISKDS